ncbi:MAG: carboxylate-amine ligase [Planctomycetota bacterium]
MISHDEESPFLHVDPEAYSYPIRFGEAIGIELEYMIVDQHTLDVRPIADELLRSVTGCYATDAEPGGPEFNVGWSNELALHIIELKTSRPAEAAFATYIGRFQSDVRLINEKLSSFNARLMPTAMHPWMDPARDLKLWPHEYGPVYHAYNRIFGCGGHGWGNLQSTHINLPFGNDEEFGRLHAAIRLILPLLPAIAASSPIVDGRVTGALDSRMIAYRGNAARIPSITARVVPEPVFVRSEYEEAILQRMYTDIMPHDPDGVLQHEWLNSRGAIARFERGSIEIRVLDIQECPSADLAILGLALRVIEGLMEGRLSDPVSQRAIETDVLAEALECCERDGFETIIRHHGWLAALGMNSGSATFGEVWQHLVDAVLGHEADRVFRSDIDCILNEGCLARRILKATGPEPDRDRLGTVYAALCDCLQAGRMFVP